MDSIPGLNLSSDEQARVDASIQSFALQLEKLVGVLEHPKDELGRVLKCHLAVEHYLDVFLAAHFVNQDLSDARLTFVQKVALLPNPRAELLRPGLKQLNKIRNMFSHQLDAQLAEKDVIPLRELLARWGCRVDRAPIDLIEYFAAWSCICLSDEKPLMSLFRVCLEHVQRARNADSEPASTFRPHDEGGP